MQIKLEIRRNADGKVVVDTRQLRVWEDHHKFLWDDGNYSCDCNRYLFFERALGNAPEVMSQECSDGKYSVRLSNADTGEILYDEFSGGKTND